MSTFIIGQRGQSINFAWCKIPKPQELPSIYKVFPGSRNAKTRDIFRILFARSLQNNGDTKITNERLAKLVKQSQRSVVRHIKRLESKGFLVTHKKVYLFRGGGDCLFKTGRVIRVWQAFAIGGYNPLSSKYIGFENDIRPLVTKKILSTIPLKYKIDRPTKMRHPKSSKVNTLQSERLTLTSAQIMGLLSAEDEKWIWLHRDLQHARYMSGIEVLGYTRKDAYRLKKLVVWYKQKEVDNLKIANKKAV